MRKFVEIRAAAGRLCHTRPVGGRVIPEDKFISAALSPWIQNYIDSGDVLEKPKCAAPKANAAIAAPCRAAKAAIMQYAAESGKKAAPAARAASKAKPAPAASKAKLKRRSRRVKSPNIEAKD